MRGNGRLEKNVKHQNADNRAAKSVKEGLQDVRNFNRPLVDADALQNTDKFSSGNGVDKNHNENRY